MSEDDPAGERFAVYEAQFDPLHTSRAARRRRKPVAHHTPKVSEAEILAMLAEATEGLEGGFNTTYRPSRYEAEWLLSSLRPLYEQGVITDVVALVKGGKEANVYRCAAHPNTGHTWLAAKVFRPRKFRNLRDDSVYREGRAVLDANGVAVRENDDRVRRAIGKKSDFGVQVARTSWLMHEYTTLERLYRAGADVPQPVASAENAILMAYVGDEHTPAPTLSETGLARREAVVLFRRVLHNIERMLGLGLIHGDLSAYNILYWQGEITLIDFPQVTCWQTNRRARLIFERDIRRTCEYFQRQGVDCDPEAIAGDLWQRLAIDLPMDFLE